MKHELEFIGKNLKAVNKMLKKVGGDLLNKNYWSSSECSPNYAWYSNFNGSYGLGWCDKYSHTVYVRPILI